MPSPVCAITGVGPGNGAAFTRCFSGAGYRVAMLARSGDRLSDLETAIPNTRGMFPNQPDDFYLKPDDIAATVLHLAQQPRSAWTFELDLRPFGEKW